MLARIQEDPNFLTNILFTDEASFSTAGMFNRRNKHYWSSVNPHKKQVVKVQGRSTVSVWCGMIGNKVLGPIIIDGNLNGQTYLNMLQNEIEDLIDQQRLMNYHNIVWQQDGAPAHNTIQVTQYLNNRYDLWIGRRGPIHWPANSPDLAPPDLFLWGYLKNKIYYNRNHNVQELIARIREEVLMLNQNNSDFTYRSITHKLRSNLQKCLDNGGGWVKE